MLGCTFDAQSESIHTVLLPSYPLSNMSIRLSIFLSLFLTLPPCTLLPSSFQFIFLLLIIYNVSNLFTIMLYSVQVQNVCTLYLFLEFNSFFFRSLSIQTNQVCYADYSISHSCTIWEYSFNLESMIVNFFLCSRLKIDLTLEMPAQSYTSIDFFQSIS